jgi:hypothetical protein
MNRWPPRTLTFQEKLNAAFAKEPALWDWIELSQAHRQDEVDKMILESLTEDAKKWPENSKHFK